MEKPHSRSLLPTPARLIGGVATLISLTVLGFVALARWRPPGEFGSILHVISPRLVVLLLALAMFDSLMGGFRYRLFFNGRIFSHVSLWHCVRSNWANVFMGAITPSQTGGGPAQLYVLCRRGAKLSDAVLASAINLVATFLFFALGGLVALALTPASSLTGPVRGVLATAVGGISILTVLLTTAIAGQSKTMGILRRFITRVSWRSRRTRRWGARVRLLMMRELRGLRFGLRSIAERGKLTLGMVVLATAVLYLNKYFMGFVLAWALQGPTDISFIGLQLLQNVVLYFAPTPGASGFAEASSGLLLNQVLIAEVTVVWVVGWRFLTTFFGSFLGMVVLVAEARRHSVASRAVEGEVVA